MKLSRLISLFIFVAVLLSAAAAAESICVPNDYCEMFVDNIETVCQGGFTFDSWGLPIWSQTVSCDDVFSYDFQCFLNNDFLLAKNYWTQPYYQNGVYQYDAFYADVSDIVICPEGCLNGQCIAPEGEGEYYPPVPDCYEGNMRCEGQDIYECIGGQWLYQENCGQFECYSAQSDYVYCKTDIYYCQNNNMECYSSSSKMQNCYDTYDQCMDSFEKWCANPQLEQCTKRYGDCLAGEYEVTGTDLDLAYQSCVESFWKCSDNFDCPTHFECNPLTHKCQSTAKPGEVVEEPDVIDEAMFGFKQFLGGIQGYLIIFAIVVAMVILSRLAPKLAGNPYAIGIAALIILFVLVKEYDFSIIGWLM